MRIEESAAVYAPPPQFYALETGLEPEEESCSCIRQGRCKVAGSCLKKVPKNLCFGLSSLFAALFCGVLAVSECSGSSIKCALCGGRKKRKIKGKRSCRDAGRACYDTAFRCANAVRHLLCCPFRFICFPD